MLPESFLIVISGVLIFILQNLFLELWIKPLNNFRATKSKIEVLILRYGYLTQARLKESEKTDGEIEFFKDELRNLAGELSANYRNLPKCEQWYQEKFNGLRVETGVKEMVRGSNIIASPGGVNGQIFAGSDCIQAVKKALVLL